jgi:putative tricarboxylic transport membrane protein
MDLIGNLALGFETALSVENLFYCFLGTLLGTLVGVLPGLGPAATVAMLLPITFTLEPTAALIMLAGIYYGAQYGGSTTAILLNLPGEATTAVTAIDGYQMARKGRAGAALSIAALGSFFAGSVATLLIALFALPLAVVARSFGPAEYFSLIVFGLVASIALAHGSVIKALAMVLLGVCLGAVGTDVYTGAQRFTLGRLELSDGFDVVAIAVGLFGLAEIMRNLEGKAVAASVRTAINSLFPTREEFRAAIAPVIRGTALGSFLGVLPGGGALLSSFASYAIEKRVSKHPETFGKGAVEGVAAPESANNAGAQTSFVPMLTLGIPSNAVMALMIGAMLIQGVVPGPNIATERPELFWGLIASMWVGNLMLVVLNLPLVGLWVKLLSVPYSILFPTIIAVSAVGVYTLSNNAFELMVVSGFAVAGYILVKLDCEVAPLLLGFILGPMLEDNMRRAMLLSGGDPATFVASPISLSFLVLAALTLALMVIPSIARKRSEVFVED